MLLSSGPGLYRSGVFARFLAAHARRRLVTSHPGFPNSGIPAHIPPPFERAVPRGGIQYLQLFTAIHNIYSYSHYAHTFTPFYVQSPILCTKPMYSHMYRPTWVYAHMDHTTSPGLRPGISPLGLRPGVSPLVNPGYSP